MRASVTPRSFACHQCGHEIEGTVVFWWNDHGVFSWRRAHDRTWCEPCWAEMKAEHDRTLIAKLGSDGPLGPNPDPDKPGYDPYAAMKGFEPKPCGHCGRSIRWGYPAGFCSDRCAYEAGKVARRVDRKPRACEVCGEEFTPKRSDAKTCSDRCRQRLRRSGGRRLA
jgi:predicted nucleic acid-binding Zn ribbon protein